MNDKKIDTTNLPEFKGGWSYETRSIRKCLENVTYSSDTINILEFGSGDSTVKLYTFLSGIIPKVVYDCYETNQNFVTNTPVNTVIYSHPTKVDLPYRTYDFILIDGPMGVDRKYWYEKIKTCCRVGTIVLIDDWNHFIEFENELQANLTHKMIEVCDDKYPLKSYKILEIV